MKIPNFANLPFVDKNGFLTPEWQQILTQLFTAMQQNLSDSGIVIPDQTASAIALLTSAAKGTLLYDSTNNLGKINIAGTFKTIATV